MDDANEAPEKEAEKQAPSMPATYWLDALKSYRKAYDKWHDSIKNVDRQYAKIDRADSADREYAIFWANLEVLKPATFARPPVPVVGARFKNRDVITREASETLERCAVTVFEQSDIEATLNDVRDDYLMYGRGTCWVRLDGDDDRIAFDWLPHSDFAHEPARTWAQVNWVARRAWLTKRHGIERFGDVFLRIPKKDKTRKPEDQEEKDKTPVWEIWCKSSGRVYFIAEDFDEYLDVQEPWIDVTGFFPCPKPCYSTRKPNTLRPIPDLAQYKDQIEEVNEYTARIAALSESLRVRGFYPSGAGDISQAIESALNSMDDRQVMIGVPSMAMMAGQSLKDSVLWLPVSDVIQVIQQLVELRRIVIEDIYQITGISDIVRGQTVASETLGAQQLKSQWGSLRIRERQKELVRFSRDIARISCEIIAENFAPETVYQMSQSDLPTMAGKMQAQGVLQAAQQYPQLVQAAQVIGAPPPPQPDPEMLEEAQKTLGRPSFEDVIAFLRNDRARGFAIQIETDSTIQPDEDAEKQRRIEFVTTVGGLFQQAAPLLMQAPMLAPFMVDVMKFAAGAFRAGRPLEQSLDELGEQLKGMAQQASQPQEPPQPDPNEQMKLEQTKAKTQAVMVKADADIAKAKIDMQSAQVKSQGNIQEMQAQAAMQAMQTGLPGV